jgi:diguanylate cyclase
VDEREEFKRTLAFGETAVGHLKANETPCYPRNYEIWYTYAAGYNQSLNRAINDILRRDGRMTAAQTEEIYDQHLSPMRFGDRVEHIGGQLSGELKTLGASLELARGEAGAYGQTLQGAASNLSQSGADREALQRIVDGLLLETKKMESRNADLQSKLDESRKQISDLHISLEAIRNESLTDPLTSLANRKCFDHSMNRSLADAESSGKGFSLLVTDIDHFKKFNDTYGHQTGDQVLRLVAAALKQNVKGQDIAARYGGEEFCVILPRTGMEAALTVAEHIREAVMGKELVKRSSGERLGRITISIGVSTWTFGDTTASMIERADAALYRAKRTGRNRVCSERDLDSDRSVA